MRTDVSNMYYYMHKVHNRDDSRFLRVDAEITEVVELVYWLIPIHVHLLLLFNKF